jgi:hypothetical protein
MMLREKCILSNPEKKKQKTKSFPHAAFLFLESNYFGVYFKQATNLSMSKKQKVKSGQSVDEDQTQNPQNQFAPLDYERVIVCPTPDGKNNAKIHTTHDYQLRSVQEWINYECDALQRLFDFLETTKNHPKKAESAMLSFRKALEISFPKEVYNLRKPPQSLSKRHKRLYDEDRIDSEEESS